MPMTKGKILTTLLVAALLLLIVALAYSCRQEPDDPVDVEGIESGDAAALYVDARVPAPFHERYAVPAFR